MHTSNFYVTIFIENIALKKADKGTTTNIMNKEDKLSAHDTKCFIILLERPFKMIKNGIYFTVIALSVAKLFKILTYAN